MLKKINYFIAIFLLIFIGAFISLFKLERIIITPLFNYKKCEEESLEKIINLNWIDFYSKKIIFKKINLNNTNKYDLFNNAMKSFCIFIANETNNLLLLEINNIGIGNSFLIIDLKINHIKNLTATEESLLIESFYRTAKEIDKKINKIYLFNNEKEFPFKFIEPYFNEAFLKKNNFYSNNDTYDFYIIPIFLNTNGNKIFNIFEKNIFQNIVLNNNNNILLFNEPALTEKWNEKIYEYKTKLLIFTNFYETSENNITFFLKDEIYNFIEDKIINHELKNKFFLANTLDKEFYLLSKFKDFCKENNINLLIKKIINKFSLSFPLIDSIYMEIGIKDLETINKINAFLNSF
jgi:hypothetical protein